MVDLNRITGARLRLDTPPAPPPSPMVDTMLATNQDQRASDSNDRADAQLELSQNADDRAGQQMQLNQNADARATTQMTAAEAARKTEIGRHALEMADKDPVGAQAWAAQAGVQMPGIVFQNRAVRAGVITVFDKYKDDPETAKKIIPEVIANGGDVAAAMAKVGPPERDDPATLATGENGEIIGVGRRPDEKGNLPVYKTGVKGQTGTRGGGGSKTFAGQMVDSMIADDAAKGITTTREEAYKRLKSQALSPYQSSALSLRAYSQAAKEIGDKSPKETQEAYNLRLKARATELLQALQIASPADAGIAAPATAAPAPGAPAGTPAAPAKPAGVQLTPDGTGAVIDGQVMSEEQMRAELAKLTGGQ